jgi:hypothetical protein
LALQAVRPGEIAYFKEDDLNNALNIITLGPGSSVVAKEDDTFVVTASKVWEGTYSCTPLHGVPQFHATAAHTVSGAPASSALMSFVCQPRASMPSPSMYHHVHPWSRFQEGSAQPFFLLSRSLLFQCSVAPCGNWRDLTTRFCNSLVEAARDEWVDAIQTAIAMKGGGGTGMPALLESQMKKLTGIIAKMVKEMTALSSVRGLAGQLTRVPRPLWVAT